MSRKIKVVDHLEWYVTQEKFQVTLDTDSGEFRINLTNHDHIVKGTTLEGVKTEAKDWLKGNAELEMKPVIVVRMSSARVSNASGNEEELMLKYERYFLGIRKDKVKVWKAWQDTGEIPEGDGNTWSDCLEGKPSNQSDSPWDEDSSKIIPYTVEKWKALRKISKLIRAMNIRLEEIVGSKELEGFLLDVYKKEMVFGLPAPKNGHVKADK
jgi:hypothetical protein